MTMRIVTYMWLFLGRLFYLILYNECYTRKLLCIIIRFWATGTVTKIGVTHLVFLLLGVCFQETII